MKFGEDIKFDHVTDLWQVENNTDLHPYFQQLFHSLLNNTLDSIKMDEHIERLEKHLANEKNNLKSILFNIYAHNLSEHL